MSYKKINLLDYEVNKTIGEVFGELRMISSLDIEFPLAVRLMENPKFTIWGGNLGVFPGAVDGTKHDYIHIILGRSFLPLDEAFVVGFCMGATRKMTPIKTWLFKTLAGSIYPKFYRFSNAEKTIFSKAVILGANQAKLDFSSVPKTSLSSMTIGQAREQLIFDWDTVLRFYEVEATDFPSFPSSKRLKNYLQKAH